MSSNSLWRRRVPMLVAMLLIGLLPTARAGSEAPTPVSEGSDSPDRAWSLARTARAGHDARAFFHAFAPEDRAWVVRAEFTMIAFAIGYGIEGEEIRSYARDLESLLRDNHYLDPKVPISEAALPESIFAAFGRISDLGRQSDFYVALRSCMEKHRMGGPDVPGWLSLDLGNVRIDGNHATGQLLPPDEGEPVVEPVEFTRSGGRWYLAAPSWLKDEEKKDGTTGVDSTSVGQ